MNTRFHFLASLMLLSSTIAANADSVSGKVVAYDRIAQIIVLADKTVTSPNSLVHFEC